MSPQNAHGDWPPLEQLLDVVPVGLLVTDARGTIRRVNGTLCNWSGHEADELLGRMKLQDLFTVGGRIFHQTHWMPILQMQGSISEVKFDLRRKDGQVMTVMLNAIRQGAGEAVHDIVSVMVAEERNKYERELVLERKRSEALSQTQLREAQDRVLFAEQMVGIVSHVQRDAAPTTAEVAQALGAPADAPLTRLLVRDQGKIFPLQVDAIECLRSDNKYTAITSKGRSFLVRLPIASFETRLDPTRFLRVQRGCIVNLDFVDSMTPDENSQLVVQLRDGTRITANREVSKMLREQSL